jgi:hypothetical protein
MQDVDVVFVHSSKQSQVNPPIVTSCPGQFCTVPCYKLVLAIRGGHTAAAMLIDMLWLVLSRHTVQQLAHKCAPEWPRASPVCLHQLLCQRTPGRSQAGASETLDQLWRKAGQSSRHEALSLFLSTADLVLLHVGPTVVSYVQWRWTVGT